jgi:hypothetical protein
MKPTMVPKLGSREAVPILEKEYAPKTGKPKTPPDRERVAVIVNHGMGQQVPYETMEGVALAIQRGVNNRGEKLPDPFVRMVRLGTEGKTETETELVRVEVEVQGAGRIYDVHVYEAYWAPLTEGKVSLKDVIAFLWDAGFNGIRNTQRGTFRRWLFGKVRDFSLPRPWLYILLFATMLLLASLMFMNGVLTAAAASHAIAGSGGFPKAEFIIPLTSDFLLADIGAVLIALATIILPVIKTKLTRQALTPAGLMYLEWALVSSGFVMVLLAGAVMPWQLIRLHPEQYMWPGLADFARCLSGDRLACPYITRMGHSFATSFPRIGDILRYVAEKQFWITAVWGIELAAAYQMRQFLIEYVGDVAAYIAAHTVSKFWELRHEIWERGMKVARAVYRAREQGTETSEEAEFLYNKVIVVGHSLGSVIGYDVLNGLLLEEGFSKQALRIAGRTRMFLTFGSPLDKTAFLFKTQKDMKSPVRAVGAAAVQPMVQSYDNRPLEWVNLWSRSDLISGHLDYYDPPTPENARDRADSVDSSGNPLRPNQRAVCNKKDRGARTPFAAHVEYWISDLFAKELVRGITTTRADVCPEHALMSAEQQAN